ncbi:hypothetical protein Vretimale_3977, partial [Volvox reticuliferus]
VNGYPLGTLRPDAGPIQDLLRRAVEVRVKVRRSTATEEALAHGGGGARGPAAAAATAVAASSTTVAAGSGPSNTAAAPPVAPSTSYQLPGRFFDVVLTPAPVEFVPVQYAVLSMENIWPQSRGGGGGSGSGATSPSTTPPSPSRVGYIRIVAFTEDVAVEFGSAVRDLQAAGCGAWLLDLRSNPGGLVDEGLEVAETLMGPGRVFAVLRDRNGEERVERLSDRARAAVEGQPLAVLVDRNSASASELLAGALHDNKETHALLYGERTYGKGRTQQIFQLNAGALLFVSTDTYVTPARRPVDGVGLVPDIACRPGPPPAPTTRPTRTRTTTVATHGHDPAIDPPPTRLSGSAAETESPPSTPNISVVGDGGGMGSIAGSGASNHAVKDTRRVTDDDRNSSSGNSRTSASSSSGSRSSGGGDVMSAERVDGLVEDACVRAAIRKLTRGTLQPPQLKVQQN